MIHVEKDHFEALVLLRNFANHLSLTEFRKGTSAHFDSKLFRRAMFLSCRPQKQAHA